MKPIIIAIDGLSGCGKSSTAKAVARKLGYTYVDSGAMYRAVTLHFLNNTVDIQDADAVNRALETIDIAFHPDEHGQTQTWLNGENCESRIRDMAVARAVSNISAIPEVRRAMVRRQRELGRNRGVVMDGRDIGTVVYPDAELKIFLTARTDVRAKRRLRELEGKGIPADLEEIKSNLTQRDQADSTRSESPLKKAEHAVEIDTSDLLFEDQVEQVVRLAESRIGSS